MDKLVKMVETAYFNKSIKGASHILSGKPCQDRCAIYKDESVRIVVVCDGHGGCTYVRSDKGAEIASEITIQLLLDFTRCISSSLFKGISFSITAQPQKNPFIDADGNKLRFEDLNDDQKKLAVQAQSYIEAEGKCLEQQKVIKELLSQLYTLWVSRITDDAKNNPFDKKEQNALYGQSVEKAYGCTLLAFLQTKDYWLSFHIGDGKIYICDQSLKWSSPVPEDCACFLNYTTSLCDNNPLIEFRYAFNGTGDTPLAIMLCSDGLEGSLRTEENLQDFYEQVICLCLDGDDVNSELESYLPSLSESGNRDDISLAGFVDFSKVDKSNIRKIIDFKKQSRTIRGEYHNKKSEIESMISRLDVLKMKFDRIADSRFDKQTELDEMRQIIKSREKEVSELDETVLSIRKEIEALESELKKKKADFDNWKFTIKNGMAELELAQSGSIDENSDMNNTNYTNW